MGNKLPQSIANAKQGHQEQCSKYMKPLECSKHMKPRVQLIVIGQREQCSKHWIQLLLSSKSNAISILPWLIPWLIVIGHQEQCSKYMKPLECSKYMKPLECSKHMKPRVQYQSYPG